MTILQIMQGFDSGVRGKSQEEAVKFLQEKDDAFAAQYPDTVKYHRPAWRVIEEEDTKTAPWGFVWYVADEHGAMRIHSAQYDSSG